MKAKKKSPRKAGRPTVYDAEHHPKLARELTAEGKTLADLAKLFGVARSTIEEWQSTHTPFSVAIHQGRKDAVANVERALYDRSVGYSHSAIKPMVVSQGDGMGSVIEMVKITEQYPPDPTAIKFYLTNKNAKEWKDRQTVEHQGLSGLAMRLASARKRKQSP